MEKTENIGEKNPVIKRGRVDSLNIYEITDYELDILEKGSPSSLYLNFAIFLLSTAFSCIFSLGSASFSNETVKVIFIVISVVGILMGMFLLMLWQRSRTSVSFIVKKIKQRIPSEQLDSHTDTENEA